MHLNKEIGRWTEYATLLDDIAYQIYLEKFGYTSNKPPYQLLPFIQESVITLKEQNEPEYLECYEKANEYLNIINRKDKINKIKENINANRPL